jgi:toxin CptA
MRDLMLLSAAVLISALSAGLMGYAIQRGATCTVAAVDEILIRHKGRRLLAMGEASVWVAGSLALASLAGALPDMPPAYPLTRWTVAGGVLLGLGAWINQACVFGAIARLGSGEWRYAATPVGFYVGCLTAVPLFAPPAAQNVREASPILLAASWVSLPFVVFAAWRVVRALWSTWAAGDGAGGIRSRARRLAARAWAPHAATSVIGVTFVVILLLVGVWAYTDVLAQLALGSTVRLALGMVCLVALYGGALLGGRTTGRWSSVPASIGGVVRCFVGGAVMAWGSLLIPGSNDGLILVGMPLLRPYAWVAFATMCISIAVAMLVARRVAGLSTAGSMP